MMKQLNRKHLKNKIPDLISKMGSAPGIKVDTGAKVLLDLQTKKVTKGLDGLREG